MAVYRPGHLTVDHCSYIRVLYKRIALYLSEINRQCNRNVVGVVGRLNLVSAVIKHLTVQLTHIDNQRQRCMTDLMWAERAGDLMHKKFRRVLSPLTYLEVRASGAKHLVGCFFFLRRSAMHHRSQSFWTCNFNFGATLKPPTPTKKVQYRLL